jgi:hypothetical protein
MKQTLLTLFGALAVATAVVAAQEQEQKAPPEVALTGCIVQGSGPQVFILSNAKAAGEEKGQSYLIVPGTEDLFLRNHLNHEVTVRGEARAGKAPADPPSGEAMEEKDLPTLTAKSVEMVSDTCAVVK